MDRELDKASLYRLVGEINRDTLNPAFLRLLESPTFYFKQVLHQMQKQIRETLVDFDLTETQFTLLMGLIVLTKDGRRATQMDLANFMKLDKMMVSEVLRTLEKKGYVNRVSNPEDKRAKSLIVTEKGIKINEMALERTVEIDEQFFSALGDDREELVRILKKLI